MGPWDVHPYVSIEMRQLATEPRGTLMGCAIIQCPRVNLKKTRKKKTKVGGDITFRG